jgi:hypothetical protein
MKEESPKLWRKVHLVALAAALIAGVVIGRAFFPLEIPKPFVVEKVIEKRVEVPVERIVEKRVEVPVDRVVEKRVEVPTEVVKYVDRMVPVEKIVYRDRETSVAPIGKGAWRELQVGMSMASVRSLLGEPVSISGGSFAIWSYASTGRIIFTNGKLYSWDEPSR